MVKPDHGFIELNKNRVYDSEKKIDIPTRERNIGYVFQSYALFPHLNVYENIIYGLKSRKREIEKEKIESTMMTLGIHHLANKNPKAISGGEKQRAALARVLVTDPDVLLLDEPFSALDIETREQIYPIFDRIKERYGIPMILISHNPIEGERFGDHRIFMDKGKIIKEI